MNNLFIRKIQIKKFENILTLFSIILIPHYKYNQINKFKSIFLQYIYKFQRNYCLNYIIFYNQI